LLQRGKEILVVDDEEIIREIIRRKIVSATDVSVRDAVDGLDALEKLAEHPVDLVITDIKMPRMNGLELITAMRERGIDTPVIIVTGYGTLNDAIEAIRLGAVNFVKKPFQTNELLSVIDRVFSIYEEKFHMKDVVPYVGSHEVCFALPNDQKLFQGVIAYVNESIRNTWPECSPNMVDIKISMYEALLNAFEHGNLGISSSEKEKLLSESPESYEKFIAERASKPPYSDRKIKIELKIDSSKLTLAIEDEGDGFDHASLPDPTDPENLMKHLGRGVLLMRNIMTDVKYVGKGNRLILGMERSKLALRPAQ
jgi:YesN/AraC family two-component response regulator